MPSTKPVITLRLEPKIRAKLQAIADDEFRPVNKEIERLVILRIEQYELEHGPIPDEKLKRFM